MLNDGMKLVLRSSCVYDGNPSTLSVHRNTKHSFPSGDALGDETTLNVDETKVQFASCFRMYRL